MRQRYCSIALILISFLSLAGCASRATQREFERKLDAQWTKYQAAREAALTNVKTRPLDTPPISRVEWESILKVGAPDALTAGELEELRRDQDARVEHARTQARLDSVIRLDEVRTSHRVTDFCARVPKGGMLHIHPWGTLDRGTAKRLLDENNPTLRLSTTLEDLAKSQGNALVFPGEEKWLRSLPNEARYSMLSARDKAKFASFLFLPEGRQPFPRFNGVFHFLNFAIPDDKSEAVLVRTFAQKAVRNGVIYVEFTGGTSESLIQLVRDVESETGLVIRLNQSFNRTRDLKAIDDRWHELSGRAPSKYIVGIDFLDNEATNTALDKGQVLYTRALLDGRYRRTMHAGELGDERNPRDAMILGAERLGHGVLLAKDPVALEYAVKIREPVEINIASNLRLTEVADAARHPFLRFLRLGLPVSLSTDDEGIFDTDVNHECELAVGQTDLQYAELKRMAFNSLATSFAAESDKAALRARLEAQFASFEKSWLAREEL